MNRVYFDKVKKHWFVSEPEDFYSFKSINSKTNEEQKQILSWTHGVDMTKYPNHLRMYDVEIENVKYFFLMRREDNKFILESEDPLRLDYLINQHDLFFVGDTI